MLKRTPPRAYLRAPVVLCTAPIELFFDIEVDPLRICYLHGVVERVDGNNDTERFIYFFAPEVSDDAEGEVFAQAYPARPLKRPIASLKPRDTTAMSEPAITIA
jgi:hypothetical protein